MTSPLLALFIRSLREEHRQRLTYIARGGLCLVMVFFLYTTSARDWANAPGLDFFVKVVFINFFFILLAGVSYFASVIAEEKEDMTLGLLRMTNLNPLSIVLGKSTSRLGIALLLFTAQIPFTMLAITLGGVSIGQLLAAYATLGAFLILVSNLALFASVVCRRTGPAAVLTGVSLFFFFAVVPLATFLAFLPIKLGLIVQPNEWVLFLQKISALATRASPFFRVNDIFTTGFAEPAIGYQVISNLVLALVFFLLAWALFDVFCAEQKESAPSRPGGARSRSGARLFAAGRPWRRALAWKDFHFLAGGRFVVLIKFLVYGAPMVAIRFWPEKIGGVPKWADFGVGVFWFMAAIVVIELAFASSAIFRIERQRQTLSSLAMLPQGIRRVAYEKLLGILPALSPAVVYMIFGGLLAWPYVKELFREFRVASSWDWFAVCALCFVVAQVLFFFHLVANLSLRVKRGALPLAIGTQFLLLMFGGMIIAGTAQDKSAVVFALVITIVATGFLHFNTGHRLEAVAAED